MEANETIDRIITASRGLADKPIAVLRQIASGSDTGNQTEANREFPRWTRGDLIYWILHRDFTA